MIPKHFEKLYSKDERHTVLNPLLGMDEITRFPTCVPFQSWTNNLVHFFFFYLPPQASILVSLCLSQTVLKHKRDVSSISYV